MTGRVPVPVDVAELVVLRLRGLLDGQALAVAERVQVSTETGAGPDGGPPRCLGCWSPKTATRGASLPCSARSSA